MIVLALFIGALGAVLLFMGGMLIAYAPLRDNPEAVLKAREIVPNAHNPVLVLAIGIIVLGSIFLMAASALWTQPSAS